MADKVEQGMSDKGTLRDPSKMVSNSHPVLYAAIALILLVAAGFAIYSASYAPPPNQPPPTTKTQ
jgi:hypothetical protein